MHVLVTGGAGFIGSQLCDRLVQELGRQPRRHSTEAVRFSAERTLANGF